MAAVFGIDPIHLGIIFLANLELGYLTPPVGLNLFLSSYRFKKPVMEVARATLPFRLGFELQHLLGRSIEFRVDPMLVEFGDGFAFSNLRTFAHVHLFHAARHLGHDRIMALRHQHAIALNPIGPGKQQDGRGQPTLDGQPPHSALAPIRGFDTGGAVNAHFPNEQDMVEFIKSGSQLGARYGIQGQGSGRMPGFGAMLTDEQIQAIVEYVRSL